MSINITTTKPGDKIRHHTLNAGYSYQKDPCERMLAIGTCYEVELLEIHEWHTNVYLVGITGSFNSVFFENIESKLSVGSNSQKDGLCREALEVAERVMRDNELDESMPCDYKLIIAALDELNS